MNPSMQPRRRYTSLRDLLRVVRNKRTHFYEMSAEMQAQLGPLPDGFLRCVFCGNEIGWPG